MISVDISPKSVILCYIEHRPRVSSQNNVSGCPFVMHFLYHMIAVSTYETTLENEQKVSQISVRKSEKSGEFA